MSRDMLQHPVDIAHYVGVRDAHKSEAFAGEPAGALLVIILLRRMGVAVHLDNQPSLGAEEIGNERAEPDLASELGIAKLAGPEMRPEMLFRRRSVRPRRTNTLYGTIVRRPPHPLTFPSLRDGPLTLPFRERRRFMPPPAVSPLARALRR